MVAVSKVKCWRCQHDHAPAFLCPACQTIQPLPAETDYFTLFDLPHKPALDSTALQQLYYGLSRKLHPDLYQNGTVEEREASLKNTAVLNRAHRTLRDPVQRGLYWLERHGEGVGKDNKQVPPELAAQVFEVQEKLAELRAARRAGGGTEFQAEVEEVQAELRAQMTELQGRLEENFNKWEADSDHRVLLKGLKTILSEIAYLRTLLRDVEKEIEEPWNAS